MIKRQFGRGKAVKADEQNTAQTYTTTNLKELLIDGQKTGITSSGYLYPDPINLHTVILISLQARTSIGERIYVDSSTGIYMKPSSNPGIGKEVYVTAYATYSEVLSEVDVDSRGRTYYKDHQNGYSISTIQGVAANSGSAIKPTIPSNSILLCDILYNSTLYTTGLITSGNIDISRQDRRVHTHSNLAQLDLITDGLHDIRTTNPHHVTAAQVGLGNVTNDAQVKANGTVVSGTIPIWSVTTGDGLSQGYYVGTSINTSTGEIPTASAIKTYVDAIPEVLDAFQYIGSIDCSTNPNYPSANKGHTYEVSSSGRIGGASGSVINTGDFLLCKIDSSPSGTQAAVGSNWVLINYAGFIISPFTSTNNHIVAFDDESGKIIIDSGYPAQAATTAQKGFVQLSDSFTGTSSGIAVTEKALSDGLAQWSNVTNDAQLKRADGDFSTFSEKTSTGLYDIMLIEDSEDGYTKKWVFAGNLLSSAGIYDPSAFYLTSSGQVEALTEKSVPTSADIIIIEDSEDSWLKKKVSIGTLETYKLGLSSSSGYLVYGTETTSTGDIGELSITSSGYRLISLTSVLDELSYSSTGVNVWSVSNSLNTARTRIAGAGVQSAAVSFGGNTGTNSVATTEKFDGTSWTASGDMNTARDYLGGCGIQSAALSFCGYDTSYSAVTEKFNGSTWSNVSTPGSTARWQLAGTGIQSAALSFGGGDPGVTAITEKFNGTVWSTDAGWNLSAAKNILSGSGVQSAALSVGGYISPTPQVVTEKFNGSAWALTGNLNTGRYASASAGTQNSTISMGGNTTSSYVAISEKFNGSTWVVTGSLNTGRSTLARGGTQNRTLSFGGNTGATSAATEKYTEPYKLKLFITALENTTDNTAIERIDISTYESCVNFSITCPAVISYGIMCEREYDTYANLSDGFISGLNILNYGCWETSGNLNTARRYLGGTGFKNSALGFGGYDIANTAITEKFNGSIWSTDAAWNLNTARRELAGSGSQNSSLSFGGIVGAASDVTEKFNGSMWSTSINLNTARNGLSGAGLQNAALSFGGYAAALSSVVEKFNGSSWSTTTNLNTAKDYAAGCGVENSALSFGGNGPAITTVTEKFNGFSWKYTGNLNVARRYIGGTGNQNSALSFGGTTGSYSDSTEKFNGYSWIITNSLNTARYGLSGSGTQHSSVSFGGYTGSMSAITEKFAYNNDIAELFETEDCYVDKSNINIIY